MNGGRKRKATERPRLFENRFNTETSARSRRCRAVLVDRSIAVSHEGVLCDGQFIAVLDRRVHIPEIRKEIFKPQGAEDRPLRPLRSLRLEYFESTERDETRCVRALEFTETNPMIS
jgi:hypothetical protein